MDDRFEVYNTAIEKDNVWFSDISKIISGDVNLFELVEEYCSKNPNIEKSFIFNKIESLRQIIKKQSKTIF